MNTSTPVAASDPLAAATASKKASGTIQTPRRKKIQMIECTPRIVWPMSAHLMGGSEKAARRDARVRTTISQGPRKNASTRLRMTAGAVGSGRGMSSSPNQYWMPYVPVQGSTAAMTTEITPVIASVTRNQGSQFLAQIRRPAPTIAPTPIDPGATSCHAAGAGATRPRSGRGGTGGGSGFIGHGTLVAARRDHKDELA
jgi:hypothetical protein